MENKHTKTYTSGEVNEIVEPAESTPREYNRRPDGAYAKRPHSRESTSNDGSPRQYHPRGRGRGGAHKYQSRDQWDHTRGGANKHRKPHYGDTKRHYDDAKPHYGDNKRQAREKVPPLKLRDNYDTASETSSVQSVSPRSHQSSNDWATMVEDEFAGLSLSNNNIVDSPRKYVVFIIIPVSHANGNINERKSIGFEGDAAVLYKGLERGRDDMSIHKIYADSKLTIDEMLANSPKRADLSIFIQQVNNYKLLDLAPQNWLSCNHEVFLHERTESQINKLKRIDLVMCKTRVGFEWVKKCKLEYGFTYKIVMTSFTSRFKALSPAECPRQRDLAVCTAGQHHWKGVGPLMDCWYAHPDLPKIVITCFKPVIDEMLAEGYVSREACEAAIAGKIPNLLLYMQPISYAELVALKSRAGVHICCSLTEGWGHNNNEARICGAVTITTNAAPMNEMIRPDCGILINPYKIERKRNGTELYIVHPDQIYAAMQVYLGLTDDNRKLLGHNGHVRYLNDQYDYMNAMAKLRVYILSDFNSAMFPTDIELIDM